MKNVIISLLRSVFQYVYKKRYILKKVKSDTFVLRNLTLSVEDKGLFLFSTYSCSILLSLILLFLFFLYNSLVHSLCVFGVPIWIHLAHIVRVFSLQMVSLLALDAGMTGGPLSLVCVLTSWSQYIYDTILFVYYTEKY